MISAITIAGSHALKIYEVEDLHITKTPGRYCRFKIVKPIFGSYFSLRRGIEHWVPKKDMTFETLSDAKVYVKKFIIKKAFEKPHVVFHDIEKTVKEMNRAEE